MISPSPTSNALVHAELPHQESKQSVAREVRLELRRSGYAEMRRVEVDFDFDDNVLILSGMVYSFHMKQLAQEIALKSAPGITIDNQLTVVATPGQRTR